MLGFTAQLVEHRTGIAEIMSSSMLILGKTPSQRTLAKRMLNSMWGKLGRQTNKRQGKEFVNPPNFFQGSLIRWKSITRCNNTVNPIRPISICLWPVSPPVTPDSTKPWTILVSGFSIPRPIRLSLFKDPFINLSNPSAVTFLVISLLNSTQVTTSSNFVPIDPKNMDT